GNWGSIPMTPHPDISEADAKTMMKYILSLK
ncbi:MAG: cytochrome c class I, partial [Bacteroidota bacterium]|nr:cytochrome c class I [Bacteroidota bacterium]